jgi:circadian clock protein KaiC
MGHSNQVREFLITGNGIKLVDVYRTGDRILLGSAREAQILRDNLSMNGRNPKKGKKIPVTR